MREGWTVVAATFIVLFAGFGAAYTFSAFFPSLEREFGATRAEISLVFSLAAFLYFTLGAVSGRVADAVGPRELVVAGMVITGLGLLAAGLSDNILQVGLGYGLGVGIGVGLAYVPAVGAVQRWFTARRGLASGFAVAGIGVGTLAMPFLAAWLIEAHGWRSAFLALAGGVVLLGGSAGLLVRAPSAAGGIVGPTEGYTVGEALSNPSFWILFLATFVLSFGMFVPFVHAVPDALGRGFGMVEAVSLVPLIGIGSTAGRFLLAPVADRIGRKRCLALLYACLGAMLAAWPLAGPFWLLACIAVVFGLSYGGFVALAPAVTADFFGLRSIGAIIGLLYSSVGFGTLLGPTLAGLAHDRFGRYDLSFVTAAALAVAAAVAVAAAPVPPRRRGKFG